MHRLPSLAIIVATALVISACGDDDELGSTPTDPDTIEVGTLAPTTSASTSGTADDDTSDDTVDDMAAEDRLDGAMDALQDGDFSTLLQLLALSGVADELENRQATLLAPTEDAFQALDADDVRDLLADPGRIDDVLRRHLLDDVYTFDELSALTEVTTIDGDTLSVSSTGGVVTIDGATVEELDNEMASGGEGREFAVFAIDQVLIDQP